MCPLSQCLALSLVSAQVAVLAFQVRDGSRTAWAVADAVFRLSAGVCVIPMSHFEHLRSLRPSSLLGCWLLLTVLLEAASVRTFWLVGDQNLAIALSVQLSIRLALLLMETRPKNNLLRSSTNEKWPREVLAGPFSRTIFQWLNCTLLKGYHGHLDLHNLPPIDDELLTTKLRTKFSDIPVQVQQGKPLRNTY